MRALCFCRYSVFGLGSRLYSNFCAFGHFVDDHLRQLGAQPILPMGEGDELSGQEESFLEWARNAFKVKLVTNPYYLDYFALMLKKIGSLWIFLIPLLLAQISFHARPLCRLNRMYLLSGRLSEKKPRDDSNDGARRSKELNQWQSGKLVIYTITSFY